MKHLYWLCVLLVLSLVACQPIQPGGTAAQTASNELPPGPTKVYEMKTAAKDPAAQFEVIEVVLDFAPGAWTPPHTHGGQTFNTVLAGELTLRENNTERVLKAGEGWSDTPDQMHEAGNEGTETARLLVTFFLPAGAQLTTVQQAGSNELPPGPTKVYEMKTAAQNPATQFEVIQVVLDFAPGAWTPPHTHGGQTFNMVLEGELTLRENDTEQGFKPGEGWSDTPDQVHAAGNTGTEKASLLVTFLLPAGAQLTTVQQTTAATSVVTAPQTDEEKIANAMTAALLSIAQDAAVLDWPAEPGGKAVELRAGSNGWVCRPDNPVTISNDPRCLDPNWLKIFGKAFGPEREANTLPGVAYMLQGDSVADNDDPSVTTPAAGQEWQINPPHIMIVLPIPWDTTVFSTDHHAGGPWVMFQGTPSEHLMVPVTEPSQ